MTWLLPRYELTPEQNRAIELNTYDHKIILGGPGSGKTQILLHRAKFLKEKYGIKDNKFHIFVFTNVLKNYISSALEILDIPVECVTTFDFWCVEYYQNNIRQNLPWNRSEKCPNFEIIRKEVLSYIKKMNFKPIYDFTLVDEGQDLDEISFEIIKRISSHVTICMDYKQKIYDQGVTEEKIMEIMGIRKANIYLLDVFRCCPYVVKLASFFIENQQDRLFFLNQSRTEQNEREMPLLYFAENQEDEDDKIIDLLHTRMLKNERIGVFLPTNKYVRIYAKKLIKEGIEVEWKVSQDKYSGQYDFNSTKPKILTYHSAKGLTFDSVIIPKLNEISFPNGFRSDINKLLFVCITRAQKWVGLISNKYQALSIIESLKMHKNSDFLTVKESEREHIDSGNFDKNFNNDLKDLLI